LTDQFTSYAYGNTALFSCSKHHGDTEATLFAVRNTEHEAIMKDNAISFDEVCDEAKIEER
jgi:hypothetical protein